MADRGGPGYGTPNWELLGRWLELPAAEDGPFWALNLMKYRAVADYGGATTESKSGREADDQYAPLGPLKAIGAIVAFHGDVVRQPLGTPVWDRVGIVRYPSRAAFFAMQRRDDFKEKHVHKEAGMETTIVLACLPAPPSAPDEAVTLLDVEGVIIGEDRAFTTARFDRAAGAAVVDVVVASADGDEFVLVVDPEIDRLVESIQTAPGVGGPSR
jgi:hypothetical protein